MTIPPPPRLDHDGDDSAAPRGEPAPTDEVILDDVLAELRRTHLIRSWNRPDTTTYEIVVGRGTVAACALRSADDVLQLAAGLRRDRITVVGPGYPLGHRTMRYDLSDGRFVDRYASRVGRFVDECPYTVYLPGGDPSGCARPHFAAHTQREALALAGLARVRGRCSKCAGLRPLRVHHWAPDPSVPCPGCDASSFIPAAPLCAGCGETIKPSGSGGGLWRRAWAHTATNSPLCRAAPEPHERPALAHPV